MIEHSIETMILQKIINHRKNDRATVIGLTGIDCSGKSYLSKKLFTELKTENFQVVLVHLDDFHNPREIRHQNSNYSGYFNDNFAVLKLKNQLLEPIHTMKSTLDISLDLLELNTNQYTLQRQYKITKDSLVILEGVFLFREEIAPFLDYSIFLHTDFSVALNRAKIRDKTQFGDQLTERYQNRYFPAQADYLSKHPLSKHADLIINNNCLDNPKILTVEEWQANFSKDFSS